MYLLDYIVFACALCAVPTAAAADVLASNASKSYLETEELLVTTLLNQTRMISVRPAVDSSTPVTIDLTLTLIGIVDINEKEGYMITTLFPMMKWHDPRLLWNASLFANITVAMLPVSEVWIPDIEVYNRYEDVSPDNAVLPLVWVNSTGEVMYVPRRHVKTVCHFDLVAFPFDKQQCEIIMGSWGYDVTKVNITTHRLNSSSFNVYESNREWDYEAIEFVRQEEYDISKNATFVKMRLTLNINRRSSYFYRLFVAPGAIVVFSIPVVHFSPAGSSEKLTLCGSMLVALTVMFTMLEDFFPAHSVSDVPILLHYYTAALLSLYISMVVACISSSLANPGTKTSRIPPLLRKIFIEKLGYFFCVSGRANKFDYELLHLERYIINSGAGHFDVDAQDPSQLHVDDDGATPVFYESTSSGSARRQGRDVVRSEDFASSDSDHSTKVVQALVTELQYARFTNICRLEWQQLSMVFDRLSGFLFFLLAIVITAAIANRTV